MKSKTKTMIAGLRQIRLNNNASHTNSGKNPVRSKLATHYSNHRKASSTDYGMLRRTVRAYGAKALRPKLVKAR